MQASFRAVLFVKVYKDSKLKKNLLFVGHRIFCKVRKVLKKFPHSQLNVKIRFSTVRNFVTPSN